MRKPIYTTANGVPLSLKNLFYGNDCSVIEIEDAVEDATTADELMNNLNSLNLFEKFQLNRVTEAYARLVSRDCWGNTHYFTAYF